MDLYEVLQFYYLSMNKWITSRDLREQRFSVTVTPRSELPTGHFFRPRLRDKLGRLMFLIFQIR